MSRRIPILVGLLALVVWGTSVEVAAAADAHGPGAPAWSPLLAVQQPAGAGGDFVPVSELPDASRAEQMPAAPMLISAYVVVWLALLVYVWSLWRRLAAVEREVADVARRVEDSRRS
jgi:CcmD family protein